MNVELEALVLSLDALLQAGSGDEASRLDAMYQSRLDDVLLRHPGISREKLLLAIDLAHRRWLRAQQRPSSLPPKA